MMFDLLAQGATIRPAIAVALVLVAASSALALAVSLRISRRIRALAERSEPPQPIVEDHAAEAAPLPTGDTKAVPEERSPS